MLDDTIHHLDENFADYSGIRAIGLPSESEVVDAMQSVGLPFHPDYIQFLKRYGGGIVGPYPIYGMRPVPEMDNELWSVVVVTHFFRSQGIPEADGWVIVSNDHAGNPIGMDKDGAIWIHDPVFGGISLLAASFEQYVREFCLKLPVQN